MSAPAQSIGIDLARPGSPDFSAVAIVSTGCGRRGNVFLSLYRRASDLAYTRFGGPEIHAQGGAGRSVDLKTVLRPVPRHARPRLSGPNGGAA
jgi:hypothetical protein